MHIQRNIPKIQGNFTKYKGKKQMQGTRDATQNSREHNTELRNTQRIREQKKEQADTTPNAIP